jgi:hypothetical protein
MFHLLNCANYCGGYLHLLIIQLIITALYTSSISVVDCDTTYNFSIMPVITRSKAWSRTNMSVEKADLCHRSSVSDHHNNTSSPKNTSTRILSASSLLLSSISDEVEILVQDSSTLSSCQVQVSDVSGSSSEVSKFQHLEISNNVSNCTGPSHNFSSSNILNMEVDCLDYILSHDVKPEVNDNSELARLFASLSTQITLQNHDIQDQLKTCDFNLNCEFQKKNSEFQKVIRDNEDFKQDIRPELDDLRQLLSTKPQN